MALSESLDKETKWKNRDTREPDKFFVQKQWNLYSGLSYKSQLSNPW